MSDLKSIQETAVFDRHAKDYEVAHDHALPPTVESRHFLEQKVYWVRTWVQSRYASNAPVRLLDFGCSVGRVLEGVLTLPQIKRAVGVDESETSLDWAKTRGSLAQDARVNFCKDLSQIESQERFDLVLVFNVLHHVPPEARSEVLKSLIARMNPQGSLVIWEHNRWNPLTRLLVKICPFDEGVVLLSRSALLNVGSKLGLKVVEASYVNVTPPHWHRFFLFFGIEKLLAGIPLGAQWRVVFER